MVEVAVLATVVLQTQTMLVSTTTLSDTPNQTRSSSMFEAKTGQMKSTLLRLRPPQRDCKTQGRQARRALPFDRQTRWP